MAIRRWFPVFGALGSIKRPRLAIAVVTGLAVFGVVVLHASQVAGADTFLITSSLSPGSGENGLYGVSCTGPTSCVAVGSAANGPLHQTLVESWDGTAWSVMPSPNEGSSGDLLLGVSCTGPTSCVAVGYIRNGSDDQTLVESWDGTAWSIISSPNPDSSGVDELLGVSCTGPTSCVAVGENDNTPLIESWDGTAWSVTPSPNEGLYLFGVSCAGPTSCVAVGETGNGTLVESWDGTAWSVSPSPSPGSQSSSLRGVSCTAPTSCVAVGTSFNGPGSVNQTLVESWDGTAWSVTPSPSPSQRSGVLLGVSCNAPNSCAADGFSGNGTLVESWDGTAWSVSPSPSPGSVVNTLYGVSCTGPTSCVAVGEANGAGSQAVVEASGQAITFTSTAPATATVGGPSYAVTASGGTSGNAVVFSIDESATSVCSITGAFVLFTGVGNCTVDANEAGTGTNAAAPQVQQSFSVGPGSQTITFTSSPPSNAVVGGSPYTPAATGGASGNPVIFTVDGSSEGVCAFSGKPVYFIGVGTCTLDANQAGNANYLAATQVQQAFFVSSGGSPPPPPAPKFTSAATDTVPAGTAFSFTVTATGSPTPAITHRGSFPSRLTLTDNHNGTATLMSLHPLKGTYHLVLVASNSGGSVQQKFTLTVTAAARVAPVFTSAASAKTPAGSAFTFSVTATGTPAPTISGTRMPTWLTLTAGHNGTATLAATKLVKGKYSFTLTATNSKGTVNQTFSLTVTKG
jgi:hypothetical protein